MEITLEKLRERKERRRKALEENLERIKAQLQEMGALKIILFGSFASGNINSYSDLDILALMPSTKTGKEWMGKIYAEVDRDVDCDFLAYTSEELEENIPVSRFLRHALKTGRVIYEKRL